MRKLLHGAGLMVLRGVRGHYECVWRNLVPPPRMGEEGPRPFAYMAVNVSSRSANFFKVQPSRNRRARIRASRNRIITERHFEQGPAPRQWISDLLPPALPHIGAAVVTTLALVVVAGAVASLRI